MVKRALGLSILLACTGCEAIATFDRDRIGTMTAPPTVLPPPTLDAGRRPGDAAAPEDGEAPDASEEEEDELDAALAGDAGAADADVDAEPAADGGEGAQDGGLDAGLDTGMDGAIDSVMDAGRDAGDMDAALDASDAEASDSAVLGDGALVGDAALDADAAPDAASDAALTDGGDAADAEGDGPS